MEPYDTFDTLQQGIQDAWNQQSDIHLFQNVITRPALTKVSETPRNPAMGDAEKQTAMNGLPPAHLTLVEAISITLNLEFGETVRLYRTALETVRQPNMETVQMEVYKLHFLRRINLLHALMDLVTMYQTGEFSVTITNIVNENVATMLRDGLLLEKLIALIENVFVQKNAKKEMSAALAQWVDAQHNLEIRRATQVLLTLSGKVVMSTKQLDGLVQLLGKCSHEVTEAQPERMFVCYNLVVAVIEALDAKYGDAFKTFHKTVSAHDLAARQQQLMVETKTFLDAFAQSLSGLKHEQFLSMLVLALSLFRRRVQKLAPSDVAVEAAEAAARAAEEAAKAAQALKTPVFILLERDFLRSPAFLSDDRNTHLGQALADFLAGGEGSLLEHLHPELLNMIKDDETTTNAAGPDDSLPPTNFTSLLSCLARLCKLSPVCRDVILQPRHSPPLFKFLAGLNDLHRKAGGVSLDSPFLPAYTDLVEALCHEADSELVWSVVKLVNGFYKLHWEIIWEDAGHFNTTFSLDRSQQAQPNRWGQIVPQRPVEKINRRQITRLKCLLRLIKAVVRVPRIAQQIFAQDGSRFGVADKMLHLLGCQFPVSLQACVLDALTHLAWDKADVSTHIWEKLEQSKILPRLPPPPAMQRNYNGMSNQPQAPVPLPERGGLYKCLESNERAEKRYPLTAAFAKLILTLVCCAPQPQTIGGVANGGIFEPYIAFLLNHVFTKLHTWQYVQPEQQWVLSNLCLAVFCRLLEDFDIHAYRADDNKSGYKCAAYRLLEHLVQDPEGGLLKCVVAVIDRALKVVGTQQQAVGVGVSVQQVEASLLFALKFLHLALNVEKDFVALLRTRCEDTIPHEFSGELLRGTPKPIITIASCVGYLQQHAGKTFSQRLVSLSQEQTQSLLSGQLGPAQPRDEESELVEIAFHAASIIRRLSQSSSQTAKILVAVFAQVPATQLEDLRQTFAQQLRHTPRPAAAILDKDGARSQCGRGAGYSGGLGLGVLHEAPTTNANCARIAILQLFLANLQLLNSNPSSLNLTHLLLGFDVRTEQDLVGSGRPVCLDELVAAVLKPNFATHNPLLAEACFQLFYHLSANPLTNKPFLRYLSYQDLFLFTLLNSLPGVGANATLDLLQRSWLMKCIALELHPRPGSRVTDSQGLMQELGFVCKPFAPERLEQKRMLILDLLDALQASLPASGGEIPENLADVSTLSCKVRGPSGDWLYNMKRLYQLATRDAAKAGLGHQHGRRGGGPSGAAPGREFAVEICKRAALVNVSTFIKAAAKQAFDGWQQIVEIVLYECLDLANPADNSDSEAMLLKLLEGVLEKLVHDDPVWNYLGQYLSQVALSVTAKLREIVSLSSHRRQVNHLILERTLQALVSHNHYGATRVYLYGVFVNYIHFIYDSSGGLAVQGEEQRQLEARNMLFSELQLTLGKVCRDAIEGDRRQRPMAFVFLSALFLASPPPFDSPNSALGLRARLGGLECGLDAGGRLGMARGRHPLAMLQKDDHLRKFVAAAADRDKDISVAISEPGLKHYHRILSFESLMSFLVKVSESEKGTLDLQDAGIMRKLCQMTCLDKLPKMGTGGSSSSGQRNGVPSACARAQQVLIAALRLIMSMLACVANDHRKPSRSEQLHADTLRFLESKKEMVDCVLKDEQRRVSNRGLTCLKLLTGILYLLSAGSSGPRSRSSDLEKICPDTTLFKLLASYGAPAENILKELESLDATEPLGEEVEVLDEEGEPAIEQVDEIGRIVVALCTRRARASPSKALFAHHLNPAHGGPDANVDEGLALLVRVMCRFKKLGDDAYEKRGKCVVQTQQLSAGLRGAVGSLQGLKVQLQLHQNRMARCCFVLEQTIWLLHMHVKLYLANKDYHFKSESEQQGFETECQKHLLPLIADLQTLLPELTRAARGDTPTTSGKVPRQLLDRLDSMLSARRSSNTLMITQV